ncbi:LeuD/DmdB family oxidoreductase small subunit [Nocardiopsis aegyptia]|uniref:3-isopropylmalate dehydratase small subunit n=1 Tax=Nocardiopsis aegyptia TaxID=220378 RepID=A0A7Z0EMX7_9ACTN|nr:3-isopropylmalate dehydratase [Nocardiopsis aegyptia]NYJ35021.1 3-isopropylmalate/(R)-2-methylmalate dehydratase small subunit [Nocardiopsis aegyptia]
MNVRTDLSVTGRAWVFGDDVNTDDMYPGFAMKLPMAEASRFMFNATRPGWSDLVEPGDVVVAGRNFGLGSSRPVAELFTALGVTALIAEQYNSLFLRNCLNLGLPAVTVPDARAFVSEGDVVSIDVEHGVAMNDSTGVERAFTRFPGFLVDMLRSGGLIRQLEVAGHLRPPTGGPA